MIEGLILIAELVLMLLLLKGVNAQSRDKTGSSMGLFGYADKKLK